MQNKPGINCMDDKETQEIRPDYMKKLYGHSTQPSHIDERKETAHTDVPIRKCNTKARDNKRTGKDMILVDLIKHTTPSYKKDLKLFNSLCETGILPDDIKMANIVPVQKKSC